MRSLIQVAPRACPGGGSWIVAVAGVIHILVGCRDTPAPKDTSNGEQTSSPPEDTDSSSETYVTGDTGYCSPVSPIPHPWKSTDDPCDAIQDRVFGGPCTAFGFLGGWYFSYSESYMDVALVQDYFTCQSTGSVAQIDGCIGSRAWSMSFDLESGLMTGYNAGALEVVGDDLSGSLEYWFPYAYYPVEGAEYPYDITEGGYGCESPETGG